MTDTTTQTNPEITISNGIKFPAETLTDDEVQRLVKACSNRAPTGIRNRALLVVLYRAGLRIAEALALKPKDLDHDKATIRVLHGKGDKARTVAVDAGALAVIDRWIEVRTKRGINSRAPLFCTLAGKPIEQAYVRALLPRLARKANVEKRVHAHGLRHTFAAQLAAEGVPLNVIQRALGHSSAATTSRYLDHIAPQEVIDVLRERQWTV